MLVTVRSKNQRHEATAEVHEEQNAQQEFEEGSHTAG